MGTDDESPQAAVARNLAAVRHRRRLSVRALSDRLAELGVRLLPSGITKIEQGGARERDVNVTRSRSVDVNELVALAIALNVSPTRLLLPDGAADDWVQLTPAVRVQAWEAWEWMTDHAALPAGPGAASPDSAREYRDERPGWLRDMFEHPVYRSIEQRLLMAGRMIRELANEQRPDRTSIATDALDWMMEELQRGHRAMMEERGKKRERDRG